MDTSLKKFERKVFAPIFFASHGSVRFFELNNGRTPIHQLSDEKITTTWLVPISFTHTHTHTHTHTQTLSLPLLMLGVMTFKPITLQLEVIGQ